MAKIDLDSMSIEELAALRDNASAKLLEKVAARQIELEAEMERLSQYGKPAKKALVAPAPAKPRKADNKADNKADKKTDDEAGEAPVAEAEAA
jgi:hypothetical protein